MILEAVVKEQLQDYLELTGKLGSFQFGYRRNKSTSTAVNTMVCQAKNDMNKGRLIAALMFDMSAAFDTVEKDTVIEKLKLLGVSETARQWINSYLEGRKQRVKIEDEESSAKELSLGTPQGSRLSPLLFNILTCDLDLYMKNGMCCNFADDTSISVEAETETEMIQKLEKDAEGMTTFTSTNNLVLNPGKTALIHKSQDISIKIGHGGTKEITNTQNPKGQERRPISNSWTQTGAKGAKAENDSKSGKRGYGIRKLRTGTSEGWTQVNTIETSRTTDLLGMTIQGDLKWYSHVTELKKTLKKRIGVLTRLKHLVPKESLRMAAEAIFTSKLRYGIATYLRPKLRKNDEGNKTLKELTVLQNDMLRVITGKKLSDQATIESLRKKTRAMSVNQLCVYHIMIETFGIVTLNSSKVLGKMLEKRQPGTQGVVLRSAHNEKSLHIPVNEGRNNPFNFYAASAWNQFHLWKYLKDLKEEEKRKASQQETEENQQLDSQQENSANSANSEHSVGEECSNDVREIYHTEKEKLIHQRKTNERALKEFKRQIKVWILEEIPQD